MNPLHPPEIAAKAASPQRLLIVIVNYKTAQLTLSCLRSLDTEARSLPGVRVVVVENASGEEEVLARGIGEQGYSPWVDLVVAPRNGGFCYGNNLAIRPALKSEQPPQYVLLLNSDTEIFPGAVRSLLEFADAHPRAGIFGSSFTNPDGSPWPYAFRFITAWSELERGVQLGLLSRLLKNHAVPRTMGQEPAPVDWVAGASMLIRRQVFEAIGLMDEGYFLYFEEVDFCLRARRAGWPCWYVPQSRVMHIAGQSTGVSVRDRRPGRLPAYYFESRHRYFLKNFGPVHTLAADLAFGLGYASYRLRRWLQRKPDQDPQHLLADFWRHSTLLNWSRLSRREGSHPAATAAKPHG
jgi:GT2 family glycosyltransferase